MQPKLSPKSLIEHPLIVVVACPAAIAVTALLIVIWTAGI
jgi:hypothetical protein